MARSADPDSAGSQWYVCLAPAPFLDGQYTVFGEVCGDGMAVVDQLAVGDALEKLRVVQE
jgi:cyclophilin family peptidyl-prolyl cis-trans isomerase